MNQQSRTMNSIKNILSGVVGQILNLSFSFINRTVFIKTLGTTYLGVNGLFTNILSVLSIAELGVGNAIIYSMYKPLADNNQKKLKGLMRLYSKIYNVIGCVVALLGISILPFLNYIIHDMPNIPHIKLIYLMFLLNSVIGYFFAYKRSILIADQKSYVINKYQYLFNIIQIIVQVIILKITNNFIIYLFIQINFTLLNNIFISTRADKIYPYLKEKYREEIDKEEKRNIFKNIYAILMYKVNAIILNSTDNIIISAFISVTTVGIYSNYLLITNAITMVLSIIFNSITASIGNLNAQESIEKRLEVYNTINFVSFWLYGFCCICLYILLNPFIELWLGSEYLMSNTVVFAIVLNMYITGMQYGTYTFRDTTGLFWYGRYVPIFASIINLVLSIVLIKKIGVSGVLFATVISRILTYFWFDPFIIYKNIFKKSPQEYFYRYVKYTIITIIGAYITNYMCSMLTMNTLSSFIIKIFICIIIPNLLYSIVFCRSKEFKYLFNIFENLLNKVKA